MRSPSNPLLWAVLSAVVCLAPATAQERDPGIEERLRTLEDQVREQQSTIHRQEETIRKLEQRHDGVDPARIHSAVDEYLDSKRQEGELFEVTAGYDGKFFLQSEDEAFRLEIGGYGMFDGRFFPRDDDREAPVNTFTMREVRPNLAGRLWKYHEFRVQFELFGGSPGLRDGWLNFHYIDEVQLRVGQFKEPYGFDQLRGFDHADFIEPPYATALTPGRDLGFAVHGKLLDGKLVYAAGFFNGDGINNTDSNDDKDFAARLELTPFKGSDDFLAGLQLGVNLTIGDQDKASANRFRTPGNNTFFQTVAGVRNDSTLMRVGANVAWLLGPASISAEWTHNEIDDMRLGALTEDFNVDAFYVQATYLLTGEKKTWKHTKPKNNFDPREGSGWGAWEVILRYQYLDVNANVLEKGLATGTEKVWTLGGGVNWYLNPHVELMLDYEYTRFNDHVSVGGSMEEEEHAFLMRVKFLF